MIRPINPLDSRDVDLNLLVSLQALLEQRNVTRAAEQLGLTQPAMSAQLARLRKVFGDPLLLPSEHGRGMTPTAHALTLSDPLRVLLTQVGALLQHRPAFDPVKDSRRFVIAANDNGTAALGLALAARVRASAGPGIRLAFLHTDEKLAPVQLESGAADVLMGAEHFVPPSMKARKLLDQLFVVAQRADHPRGTGPLDLDAYCALDHVLVSLQAAASGYIDARLALLGRSRHVAVTVQNFALAAELVGSSDIAGTFPGRLAQRYRDRLELFPLPFDAPGFPLFCAWHPRNQADPAITWLREQIVATAAEVAASE